MAAIGASLVSISPQAMEYNRQIVEEHKLSFEVLSDPRNQLARDFGLVLSIPANVRQLYLESYGIDLTVFNKDNSWTLPMPAHFIVDQSGIVRYAAFDPDYMTRPEPTQTIDALKAVCGG